MIDMHVGFTGGELAALREQPSYFRAALHHLRALNHLIRLRPTGAARAELAAARELVRAARADLRRLVGKAG